MDNNNRHEAALAELEHIIATSPAGTLLPAYRELQQRFRISSLTAQRLLSSLAARGLVVARPGRGTFTSPPRRAAVTPDVSWQTLALSTPPVETPGMDNMLRLGPPGQLELTNGFLDDSLQPLNLLAAASRVARRPQGWNRLPRQGLPELRSHFAAEIGNGVDAADVLVTAGGQAALTTVFRYLAAPGQPVVMESPTYLGALAAARAAGLVVVPVAADEHGVPPQALAEALSRSGARLAYLQPRYANPTGVTLHADRRAAVIEAAEAAGAFLIEDDWVKDLDLGKPAPAPLISRDDHGHVVYIRSLTKPVSPGLRVAGLVARGPAQRRLLTGHACDMLFVPPILQHIALDVLTAPGWPRHLARVRRVLRSRRDTLLSALRGRVWCPPVATPDGGVHVWLPLPRGCDETALVAGLARRQVRVNAGAAYFPAEPTGPFVRLSFAGLSESGLVRAVEALDAQVKAMV